MKQPKKKSSSYQNKLTPDEFNFLLKNEVKVYPVTDIKKIGWFIEVSIHGKVKRFNKPLKQDEIQEAIDKTLLHYYKELKSKVDE
jgi:hypothetical protein